ncbi:hypothetical protein [Thermocatellispora tengchongensis]|uniref:hypothetical protein n=1 Tax=Thermocatellispora tengchongensis TaxID=1073253 RepID=UPI00362CF0E0
MSSETHIEAHDAADPRLEKNNDPEYRAKGRKRYARRSAGSSSTCTTSTCR